MKGFPDLPPLWLLAHMAAAWLLARLLPGLTLEVAGLRAMGMICALFGLAVIFWAGAWFLRKRTTIEPHHAPTALIIEGPYKLSRNPIYLGLAVILAGQIIWMGAVLALPLIATFFRVITRRFAVPEEAALTAAFGSEAEAYLGATRRWL